MLHKYCEGTLQKHRISTYLKVISVKSEADGFFSTKVHHYGLQTPVVDNMHHAESLSLSSKCCNQFHAISVISFTRH